MTFGGLLFASARGGNDSVTFGNATTASTAAGDVLTFGNGNDTFTFNALPTSTLTGQVDGGGRVTANTFNLIRGMIGSPFTLINFP